MRQSLKAFAIATGILACLAHPSTAASSWANIQPAYNTKGQHTTTRIEAGATLSDRLSCYGFLDAHATPQAPTLPTTFYGEGRVALALGHGWSAVAEYNAGTGTDSDMRVGTRFVTSLGKGNTLAVKLFPFDLSRHGGAQSGPQVSAYVEQNFGAWNASIISDYNFEPNTALLEAEVNRKLNERLSVFGQLRAFGNPSELKASPVVGFKYTL